MLGKDVPYNPEKAMDLFQKICNNGDAIGCFTLGTMLLRGEHIDVHAGNATPDEARGIQPIKQREGEMERSRRVDDPRKVIVRDPKRAEEVFLQGCERSHGPSCFDLAVLYRNGDDGIPKDEDKFEYYKKKTEDLIKMFGGF